MYNDAICGRNIRRRSEQADRDEDQGQELYDRIYAEVESEHRAEYEAQFSHRFLELHPFKPNGAAIHRIAQHRIAAMRESV